MQGYPIFQGQTVLEFVFAFLLIAISSYMYISWEARVHRVKTLDSKPLSVRLRTVWQTRIRMRDDSSSSVSRLTLLAKGKASPIAEWLAPIIVWLLVMWTGLVLVSLLLENK
jgi:hypothetical protein